MTNAPAANDPAANASGANAPAMLRFKATKLLHTAQGPRMLDITFECEQGRLLAVYGPSGAGKTTLLRILAGLTDVLTGHIEVDGDTWLDSDRKINLPTRRRPIGFVFQDFALFPHLTVRQQLEFALQKKTDRTRVDELLSLMELEELQHRRPALLSGGQQQRIAIARAIARRPRLLLLDEPLSALDDDMRNKLQEYILMVHRHYGLTTLLVSHHLPEVLRLADEAILIENGTIGGQGPPTRLFAGRQNPMSVNHSGEIVSITPDNGLLVVSIRLATGIIHITQTSAEAAAWQVGQQVTISISP
jgi:molybdate transport system ATP-binding protein